LLISNARSEKWELSVGYDDKRTEIWNVSLADVWISNKWKILLT
jgi:hypothetical protein